MKLLRKILIPFVPLYYMVVFLRNKLYDWSIFKSKSYDFPLLCVGNLSVGGTGKTPMVEYLVSILKPKYQLATLSRGYGRQSKGFVLANKHTTSEAIGDEPLQLFNKFPDIKVAVAENRQHGLFLLKQQHPSTAVVILDDAYQHRKVIAGFNILLTAYDQLYCNDYVLPTGNLREPRSGAERAQAIIVTKSPNHLSAQQKNALVKRLSPTVKQEVFFSSIRYSDLMRSATSSRPLMRLKSKPFTLVTGIANPKPLVTYLTSMGLDFEHLSYKDHHEFSKSELEFIHSKDCVLTTEKDFSRLNSTAHKGLFYLPIQLELDRPEEFEDMVETFIEKFETY